MDRRRFIIAFVAPLAWASSAAATLARPPDARRVTVALAGDVLFDRGVRDAIAANGVDALLDGVAPILSAADLAVVNLECPLSRRGLRAAKPFSFRGDPTYAQALARAGVDAVSLANNHSLDYGRGALTDTVDAVRKAGMAPLGAGATRGEAMRPVVLEANGLRVAFVAYCDLFVEGTTPREDAPGIATGDRAALLAAVRGARANADVVVVFMHWGVEYRTRPTDDQRTLARELLAAGADAVVGAHPHVIQPLERVGAGVVAYSLGNFVFDQRNDGADAVVLRLTLSAAGVEAVDVVPIRIDACRPAPASGADAERILRRLAPSSTPGAPIPAGGLYP